MKTIVLTISLAASLFACRHNASTSKSLQDTPASGQVKREDFVNTKWQLTQETFRGVLSTTTLTLHQQDGSFSVEVNDNGVKQPGPSSDITQFGMASESEVKKLKEKFPDLFISEKVNGQTRQYQEPYTQALKFSFTGSSGSEEGFFAITSKGKLYAFQSNGVFEKMAR